MSKILTIVPIRPGLHPKLIALAYNNVSMLSGNNPSHEITVLMDHRGVPPMEKKTPWSKVAVARNAILDSITIRAFDYLLWIDADVVRYPPSLPSVLINANPEGITAPFVLIEGTETFYDFAAFVIKGTDHIEPTNRARIVGRNLQHECPYWPESPCSMVVEMDCVGTITMVPVSVYLKGVRYEDVPAFTDHYPICKAARDMGMKVCVDRSVVTWHANLPDFGEEWH